MPSILEFSERSLERGHDPSHSIFLSVKRARMRRFSSYHFHSQNKGLHSARFNSLRSLRASIHRGSAYVSTRIRFSQDYSKLEAIDLAREPFKYALFLCASVHPVRPAVPPRPPRPPTPAPAPVTSTSNQHQHQ
jgi:hypothetical protein